MGHQIFESLSPVRRRQRLRATLQFAVRGLLVSSVAGLLVGLLKLTGLLALSSLTATVIVLAGPMIGAIVGFCLNPQWQQAAAAVDAHYGLKDRTVTALEFLDQTSATPFHELQLAEATSHLSSVDARQVVAFRQPPLLRWSVAFSIAACTILFWPLSPQTAEATVEQPPGIAEAADVIAEQIAELEQFAEEQQEPEIEELVEELQAELQELRDQETDVKDALATISEMQAKLAERQKQYNTAAVDAQLNSLSEAMAAVEAFKSAAAEMKAGDYEDAADELERLQKNQDVDMARSEARAAGEKLDDVARLMKKSGNSQMSDNVSQLSQGCKSQSSDKICKACNRLSKDLKKHSVRKMLASLLKNKLDRLSECKSMCQGGQCKSCGSSACKGGGNCRKNSLAEGKTDKKSNKSSSNWGKKSHGGIDGDKTQLASTRQLQEITGQAGDGPSEYETSSAPEGEEQARRQYKQAYDKYQKMSEVVLESEPIPLGQRQVIRRYFELIRPSLEDALADDTKTSNVE
ncbi:MAG: hypothetical protein ACYTGL_17720 [Planctomycetota bacterium]|jgi:hypothetical protein